MPSLIDQRLDAIFDCLYRISAKAIILQNKKLLLVNEQKDGWWSLPGGGIDHGETIPAALTRELSEELGVSPEQVTVDENIRYATIGEVADGIPRASLIYRVDIPENSISKTDHVNSFGWFTYDELHTMRISPTIGTPAELLSCIQVELKRYDAAEPMTA
jgi:8-oxo-dGTP pyrophosphatase MutT (NUDIX family)